MIRRRWRHGDDHVVIFCGPGDRRHRPARRILGLTRAATAGRVRRAYEHHSNELAWSESHVDVIADRQEAAGRGRPTDLDAELIAPRRSPAEDRQLLGRVQRDRDAHRRGRGVAGCCTGTGHWRAGTTRRPGPYLPIDVPGRPLRKDAVIISPHKFVGGPDTPGVLVVHRELLRDPVPMVPAGGTISSSPDAGTAYHPEPAIREQAGTPAIVDSIRAGLAFAVREAGGPRRSARGRRLRATGDGAWSKDPS